MCGSQGGRYDVARDREAATEKNWTSNIRLQWTCRQRVRDAERRTPDRFTACDPASIGRFSGPVGSDGNILSAEEGVFPRRFRSMTPRTPVIYVLTGVACGACAEWPCAGSRQLFSRHSICRFPQPDRGSCDGESKYRARTLCDTPTKEVRNSQFCQTGSSCDSIGSPLRSGGWPDV